MKLKLFFSYKNLSSRVQSCNAYPDSLLHNLIFCFTEKTNPPQADEESSEESFFGVSPQGARNKTREIPLLRPESQPVLPFQQAGARPDNFSSLSFLEIIVSLI